MGDLDRLQGFSGKLWNYPLAPSHPSAYEKPMVADAVVSSLLVA